MNQTNLDPRFVTILENLGRDAYLAGKSILVSNNQRMVEFMDDEPVDDVIDIVDTYQLAWVAAKDNAEAHAEYGIF